jgi:putative transposase
MPTPTPAVGYRALRAHRVSLPGHIYLVTTTTHLRQRLFEDFVTARVAVRALNDLATLKDSQFLTWVLMPDHLHLLVQLGEGDQLSQLVNRLKSRMGREVNRCLGRSGAIWQSGFHEHLLRGEEDVKAVARYVVMNPLRAGLVARVSEYPHWDAIWL